MGYISPVVAHYIVISAYICGLGLIRERTIARSHVAGSGSALITETQPGIMAECSSCIGTSGLSTFGCVQPESSTGEPCSYES